MIGALQAGDVIQQKYRLERVIGEGGMAIVVAAWHLHLGQMVAIKLIRPEVAKHPDVVARFLREARAVSQIGGEHVARVIDVDALPDGLPFIVMEYLDGADLARILGERGALPPGEAALWVQQACAAIADAHDLGIIHRDLKPANLFVSRKRSGEAIVKVLDFGISKLLAETRLTATSIAMGSAEYMSPEQMQSTSDVDPRTDLWSLGATLYELCTGRSPFHAEGVGRVCIAVMTADPKPPRQLRPDLPPGLEAVILRCLQKDRARRYGSARELAAALAPFAAPPEILAVRPAPAKASPEPPAAAPIAPVPHPVPAASPARWAPPAPVPAPAPKAAAPPSKAPLVVGVLLGCLAGGTILAAFALGRAGTKEPAARYRLETDTLLDTQSKLTWQRRPGPGAMSYAAAKAYCDRSGAGYRLPEVGELTGLLDVTRLDPPLDPASFPTSPVDAFWSSSPAPDGAGGRWVVHFFNGRVATSAVGSPNRVRCVR